MQYFDTQLTTIVSTFYINLAQKPSNELLKASVWTMPLENCSTMLKDPLDNRLKDGVASSQYCAYDNLTDSDSCQGDSGGPLQLFNHNVHMADIVGIISFGKGCGYRLPAIYTRVAYYVGWIERIVWTEDRMASLIWN